MNERGRKPSRERGGTVGVLPVFHLFATLSLLVVAGVDSAWGQGSNGLGSLKPAYLHGGCQVPPNDSPHIGYGSFFLPKDSTQLQARVTCPLSFEPQAAAIHGPGGPNRLAPLIADMGAFTVVTTIVTVVMWPTNFTYTNIARVCSNTVNLSPQEIADFEAGRFYVNVSSTGYPKGEVRGQITSSAVLTKPRLLSAEAFSFNVTGPLAVNGAVEASTNLTQWTPLTNVTTMTNHMFNVSFPDTIGSGVALEVVDQGSQDQVKRFYRVRQP